MAAARTPARKRFGQHFLEPAWVQKLVTLIEPAETDTIIEIGAGRGGLTRALAPRVQRVRAIEIDRDLAWGLAASAPDNVEIVVGDILALNLETLCASREGGAGRLRVAGNLPYYISAPILWRLTDLARLEPALVDATLMLQREVVDRLIASPGTKPYGALTLLVRLRAEATRLATLPRGAFRPPPKVESAVVRLRFHPPAVQLTSPRVFESVVKLLFSQRRKTLLNALRPLAAARGLDAGTLLAAIGIDARRRPETLDLEEFAAIAELLAVPPASAVL